MTSTESNRPLPQLSRDDVVDFLVAEAILVKVGEDKKKAQKEQERRNWLKGHRDLQGHGSQKVMI